MMVTAHVAVGAAVGAFTGDPVLAFLAGTASHFVMDAVPHLDAGTLMPMGKEVYQTRDYIWAALDAILCLGFIWLLSTHAAHPSLVIAGGLGGLFPDAFFHTPPWRKFTRNLPGFHWVQERIHKGWQSTAVPADWFAGLVTQLIAIGVSLWLLGF